MTHWKDRELGHEFVPLQADVDPEDTANWLKQRRLVTASSAAVKAGASKDSSAQDEADWDINHVGEQKPDPNGFMIEGHAREDSVAIMGARVIFPYPELLPKGYKGVTGFDKAYMYFHPDMPDLISATPDRLVGAHPEPRVFAEIKYSRYLLRTHPKVDHMFQTEMQMECVGSDYIFLVYGHLDGNCAVFLIQKCPQLWAWMHERHLVYIDYVKKKQIPPKDAIPFLGYTIKEKWEKGQIADWVKEEFPDRWSKPEFYPPQPRWQLVGYFTDGSKEMQNFGEHVERCSPSGPVEPSIFRRALAGIWDRIGVDISFEITFASPEEQDEEAAIDGAEIEAALNQARQSVLK